jgi:hypothetical protein
LKAERAKTDAFCLACKSLFKIEVQKEVRFHPTRMWRFDYAIPELKIAIEVEGGIWKPGGGRHNRGAGFRADIEKYNTAALMGWRVFRAEPEKLMRAQTFDLLREAIDPIKEFTE